MPDLIPVSPRRTALTWLVIAVLVQIGLSWFVNLIVFPGEYMHGLVQPTGGLIQPTLLANLLFFAVVVGLVVCFAAGQRPRHLGLYVRDVLPGVAWLVGLWGVTQLVFVIITLASGRELAVYDQFASLPMLGSLLGQLLGNALFEEVFFRAFLISQFWFLFERAKLRLTWTLVVSQLVFAIAHIPNRLMKEVYKSFGDVLLDQTQLFAVALLMTWMWIRTRNLLAVVAMHALVNYSPILLEGTSRGDLGGCVAGITLAMLIGWEAVRWRRRQK